MTHTLHLGDCRDVLATMGDATVDAIVCDPPYELGFMGKTWDASGIAYDVTVWAQCLRVLKPGGHLIAFGGSRTYHRLAVAIEDAGFEIRDQIQWIYGSGFPKSLDVSKAMDRHGGARADFAQFRDAVIEALKRNGQTRGQLQDVLGNFMISHYLTAGSQPAVPNYRDYCIIRNFCKMGDEWDSLFSPPAEREVVVEKRTDMFGEYEVEQHKTAGMGSGETYGMLQSEGANINAEKVLKITAPSTDLAKQWHGWGTALKPAHEPAVLARKPLRGTVADTVAQWGTGALNIEGTRVGSDVMHNRGMSSLGVMHDDNWIPKDIAMQSSAGRWPSNVILEEEAASLLGEPSRFFYVAKASKAEREAGLDGVELRKGGGMQGTEDGTLLTGSGNIRNPMRANHHPTVKPLALMRYLVRMVTPPGGVVLDPFMGSGSTGCAAVREGFDFVGIDLTPEYVAIAQKRIDWHAVTSPLDNVATMELHEENDA